MSDKHKIDLRIHDSVQKAIKMDLTTINEEINTIKRQIVRDDAKLRLLDGKIETQSV